MNRKDLRLSLAMGLAGVVLIILAVLLSPATQKGNAHSLAEAPQQPPAVAAGARTEPEWIVAPARSPQTASALTTPSPAYAASGVSANADAMLNTTTAAPPPMPGDSSYVIGMDSDRVWGMVMAGNTVTVTVDGVQMGAARADGNGFFWTTLYKPDGDRPYLDGGETVIIYNDGSEAVNTTLRSVTGEVDPLANTVIGVIDGIGLPLDVTLYFGEGEPNTNSQSQTATTDISGTFTVTTTSTWDILGDDQIVVAYTENSVDVYQRVYAQRLVVLPFPFNSVVGWTTPDTAITLTIYLPDQTTIREQHAGMTARRTGRYSFSPVMQEGDTVVVEVAEGSVMSRTVDPFAPLTVDASNNRVSGQTLPNTAVRGRTTSLLSRGYEIYNAATTASGAGAFTLSFSSPADIMPGQWAGACVADAEGDELCLWAPAQGSVIVNQTTNEVSGWAVAPPGSLADGHPLTLTLYSAANQQTYVYNKGANWYGQYAFNQDDGLPDLAAGDIVTVESAGFAWQGSVPVRSMSIAYNLTADNFTGSFQSPSNQVEVSAAQWDGWADQVLFPLGGTFDALANSSGSFTAATPGFDVRNAVEVNASHRTSSDLIERVSRTVDYVRVWQQYNGLVGILWPPGTPYMATLRDSSGNLKAQVNGMSYEPLGDTGLVSFDGTGAQMQVGDQVRVTSLGGFDQTVQVVGLTLQLDEANDHVSGFAPPNTLLSVYVDGQGTGFVPTDATGYFAVNMRDLQDLYGDGNLVWGQWARVCYQNEEANLLCINYDWPQIVAHYAMDGYSEVWGYGATPNSTLYITVTNPGGGVVATGSTPAGSRQGDTTGFSLELPDDTVRPGNIVTVNFGSGVIESVTVVDLDGTPDVATDIVEGRGPADSLLHLNVDCWRGGCWGTLDDVPVDGSGHFVADFGANGNPPHDIRYGDNFNIHHSAYHNHQTQYSFWLPMAEVGVQKNTPGGFARPGGVYVYTIEYWNDGMSDAADVRIVDTLPAGASWASDTSGVTPEIVSGGVIAWNLGTLPPPDSGDNRRSFAVTLNVADTVTENLPPNCVAITTSTPGDDNSDNDTSCTGAVTVEDSQVGISVDKWANPGDLAPGQKFDYTIRWCSEGGAHFGPVWITDTLPLWTTFLGWDSEWPQELWTELSATDEQLVLHAAGLPGDRCQDINVHLQLDSGTPLGTVLKNVVVASTPDDVNPANNIDINTDARVRAARYDMRADKWINQGVLVPGGWLRYGASYQNAGNTAVHAYITDTLPSGTSYRVGSGVTHDGQPFEPLIITANTIVWDLGVVDVNSGAGFDFILNVGESVGANTVLNNCITVGTAESEISPKDNTACVSETILASGPNLRVVKASEWRGDGQLGYNVNFYNLGDQAVLTPWITDTLPADTNWDGWWNLGFDWGRLTEQDLNNDALAWQFAILYPGDAGSLQFNANLENPGTLLRWYTNTVAITDPTNDANHADNTATDVAFSGGEVQWVELDVYRSHIWGCANTMPITITSAAASLVVDWGACWDERQFSDTFDPGDVITVTAGAGLQPVIITVPDPFTGHTSSITDSVWGEIDALNHEQVQIELQDLYSGMAETDTNGRYSKTLSTIDIPHGAPGDVIYTTEIDYAKVGFHHRLVNPDLVLQVNYAHDWIEGEYEPGHTLVLTVTDSLGAIKATAALTTGVIPWQNDRTGFSTNLNQPWFPERPDIVPGDWVHGIIDGIHASSVKVGALDSVVDTDSDLVTVTLQANWHSQVLAASCNVENGPSENFSLAPDGGSYVCDFGLMGWDLLPGQNVWLWYTEPDWNRVGNVVAGPAPHLRINTWGDADPGVGGNFMFHVSYRNEGDGIAEATAITATLQGATYLADTSGLSHSGGGSGPIVWDVGDLAAGDGVEFYLFVRVTANAGETVGNIVQIATANPYDTSSPGERESEWHATAQAPDVMLNINKWSWTGDPAPDTDIVFTLDVCNNGSTASSDVTITDTLDTDLTLQTWWTDQPGWEEVHSSAHELVVTRPTVSGRSCAPVYVRAHVNAAAAHDQPLTNLAVLSSAGNTYTARWDGLVSEPHTNLSINKSWNRGQLVPGGKLYYNIGYGNSGNLPITATFRITDTLPANTTYSGAHLNTPTGQTPFTPTLVGNGYVVWKVNGLDAGYNVNFEVVLDVAWDAAPGTILTNTAAIGPLPDEDTYNDNASTWTETLNAYGPNLRVRKEGRWDNWGTDTRHASYRVNVENIGNIVVNPVVLTDTYDSLMHLDSGIGSNYWRWWEVQRDDTNHTLTVAFESLYPGESVGVDFATLTNQDAPLPFGLIFTNTAEITLPPNDIVPADNTDILALTTGPDLFVKKTLIAGDLLPGELITFSLVFGNDHLGHEWWWNLQGTAWLTDTLPAELEYVASAQHWCETTEWCALTPNKIGQTYTWELWPLRSGEWNEIHLTVRITDTATGIDTFTNRGEIATDRPTVDIEPYYDNNNASADVVVDLPYFEVGKAYESTAVAGQIITYTLTVTNIGNSVGTGVILSDTLPAELGDPNGGTIILPMPPTSMWWYLDSIAPLGGTATAGLTATLPCRGTVVNADYRVVDSDQGVSSAIGAPVSVDVLTPTFTIDFLAVPTPAPVSTTVAFTDATITNGPPLVEWTWNFGDGAAGTGITTTHTYLTNGELVVTLTVTDACGYSDFYTRTLLVNPPALAASFTQSALLVEPGVTVDFTDTSTTDLPPIVAWTWDFGDNSSLRFTQNVSHTYTTEDIFTVTLTITDTLGYSDSYQSTVRVVTDIQHIYLPLVMRNY